MTFSNVFSCMKIFNNSIISWLKFVPKGLIGNNTALVQIMAWHLRGDKPLSEPMMSKVGMHICVTRPQWVNIFYITDTSLAVLGFNQASVIHALRRSVIHALRRSVIHALRRSNWWCVSCLELIPFPMPWTYCQPDLKEYIHTFLKKYIWKYWWPWTNHVCLFRFRRCL